jgi:hypothetical protein
MYNPYPSAMWCWGIFLVLVYKGAKIVASGALAVHNARQ